MSSIPRGRFRRGIHALILLPAFLVAFVSIETTAQAAKAKPVSVFPEPGTPVASDTTTFSFRGVKPRQLGPVKVYGARSGFHRGRRLAHSDGRGVSFIPKRKFVPGELVKVYTHKRIKRARGGDFRVRIGRFYGDDDKTGKPGAPNHFPRLKSRPDLRPPHLKVLTSTDQASPGRIFFAPKQTGLAIADNSGRLSWFRPSGFGGNGQVVQNFRPQTYRGKPVLTYWNGASSSVGFSQIGRFNILNQNYNQIARLGMGNGYKPDAHEFIISPRNTALVLAYRGVNWDTSKYGGSKNGKVMDNVVQELDIKTGAVLFEWHSLGNVRLDATLSKPEKDGSSWDYFHVNSVTDDGDSFLVSARKTSTIYRIDRRSGWVRWRLRGDRAKPKTSDFKLGPGAAFGYQHDVHRLPNGDISLFDNGSARAMTTVQPYSSGMILRLRGKGKNSRATLIKRFRHRPKDIVSASQGSAQVLTSGNVFVGWGSESKMTEFTPDGHVAFDASFLDAPKNSYRARKAYWQGVPKRRPAVASHGTGHGATVWASWNGAQNIDRWRVFTGPNSKQLRPVDASSWKGLETAIPVKKLGHQVQVRAYDSRDRLLGQSAVTPIGKQTG